MSRNLRLAAIWFCLMPGLCACAPANSGGQGTELTLPTLTYEPTATATHQPEPTLTATPVPVPTPALPPEIAANFLYGNQPEGCVLPCWQGLRIGESNAADVQATFDKRLGLSGLYDLFQEEGEYIAPVWIVDAPGYFTTGDEWTPLEDGSFLLSVSVNIDEDSERLEGIRFEAVFGQELQALLPESHIQELGYPDQLWMVMHMGSHDVWFKLSMLYQAGIFISYDLFELSNSAAAQSGLFCLDEMPVSSVGVYLTAPYSSDSRDALQQIWVYEYLERHDMRPVEEVLDMTIDQFFDAATSDNPCYQMP